MAAAEQLARDIEPIIGEVVQRVLRIFFVTAGVPDVGDGAMELHLASGHAVLFDVAGDGERLIVKSEVWTDPFEMPLSDENRQFVEVHGQWARFDVSHDGLYMPIVGRRIERVAIVRNEKGSLAGVVIATTEGSIVFVAEADECHVYSALPSRFTAGAWI